MTSGAPRLVWRLRLVVLVMVFAALAFRQSTGLVVPDTKLDLTADPASFLARALHLWDPNGSFGQLQNQAYGYLFPVGPLHLLVHEAGVPAWVVQRLWWTLLFTVALLGMWALTRRLGITDPWARLAGAAAYALAPRVVSEVAVTSVEVWPMAVAPWILLPLVMQDKSIRWRVTRSALAFACVGGINGAASVAVLVVPALWIATRRWDAANLRLAAAWSGCIALASAWWVGPLLLLSRYSPPFLSWIENASLTTSTASPFEAVRGTTPWLGFLTGPTGPSWPAGWLYLVTPAVVIASMVVAGLGLAGITRSRIAHAPFLVLSATVGLALVTLGHVGGGSWPWATQVQQLLDGPLAPFRNTHKFEAVVRLPLALGFAFAVGRMHGLARGLVGTPWVRRLVLPVVVGGLVVTVASPALGASMARPEAYREIPQHWRQAAAWLDAQPASGAVLVAPDASFSDLTWGSTKDEPLQALANRPFVVRDAVPLGSAGATRLLDSMSDALSTGTDVPGLAATLSRSGIAFVLVRNELRLDKQGAPPAVVEETLRRSGLSEVAHFGPLTGAYGESADLTVDYRTLVQRPAIVVYSVPAPSTARLVPESELSVVAGGPENLVQLAGEGAWRDTVLAGDAEAQDLEGSDHRLVLTDGSRRREVNFGRSSANTSALLAADDPGRSGRKVIDYDVVAAADQRTSLEWRGVRDVTASSSASDAYASLRLGPGFGPAAALDGDPSTRWVSGTYGKAVGEWLQIDLDAPRSVAGARIQLSSQTPVGAAPLTVRVDTDTGHAVTDVFSGPAITLVTPPGRTSHLRVTLTGVASGAPNGLGITELEVPGVHALAVARLPAVRGASAPDSVLLQAGKPGHGDCAVADGRSVCAPSLSTAPEEQSWARAWTAPAAATYGFSGRVRAVDGAGLERLLRLPSGWSATASSRLVSAPRGRPDAALDADLGTGWVASPTDPAPWYEVHFPTRRRVSGIVVAKSFALPASTPVVVHVRFDDGTTRTVRLDENGRADLPAQVTRSLHLTFDDTRLLVNIDSRTGARSFAPVGFSELRVEGAEDLRQPLPESLATGVPCGFGPRLVVGGRTWHTSVSGTVGDILDGQPLRWQLCGHGGGIDGGMRLPAGETVLETSRSAEFAPLSLALTRSGPVDASTAQWAVASVHPTPAEVVAAVPERATSSVLVLAQNFNRGWTASTPDGTALRPLRVNGWQQGWVLPAGAATQVLASFEPDRTYRAALLVGLALLGLLVVLALWPAGGRAVSAGWADASDGERPRRRALATTSVAGVIVCLAGGVAACLAVGVVLAFAAVRGTRTRLPYLAAAAGGPAAAAVVVALRPWPANDLNLTSWGVQALVWLGVSASALLVGADAWTSGRERDVRRRA
ncbi:alpha-(1-_3)-arabinofuranosyltransferase domain-containing protein [Monashia sp. NPDC004114]